MLAQTLETTQLFLLAELDSRQLTDCGPGGFQSFLQLENLLAAVGAFLLLGGVVDRIFLDAGGGKCLCKLLRFNFEKSTEIKNF